ncbi:hypothetical protein [Atopococcus tabaci]|uniref:hypothetical protein n=1 Tax=Atopococcus tabaci TaxID=269774 RepID=UPI00040C22F0|nr:hypothetical protein [Atopococcus tabaci]
MNKKTIGLFRVLTVEDLDRTARLLKKYSPQDAYDILNEKLMEKAPGDVGRRKLVNNLMMIWGNGKKEPANYQKKAMEVYNELPKEEQLVLHYLLALIAFPFLTFEARLAGKYLGLMDTVSSKVFMDEVMNKYGNSGTITRSVSNGFGILREFGFLKKEKAGRYSLGNQRIIVKSTLLKNYIVLAALLNTDSDTLSLEAVQHDKMFFGLDFILYSSDLDPNMFEVTSDRVHTYIKKR